MASFTTASFSITGESITRHVRQLVTEGSFSRAVELLQESFELTSEQLEQLLKGKTKITGNAREGMNLEDASPEDAAHIQDALSDITCCTVQHNGKLYEVVAYLSTVHEAHAQLHYDRLDVSPELSAAFDALQFKLQFCKNQIPDRFARQFLLTTLQALITMAEVEPMVIGAYRHGKPVLCLVKPSKLDLPVWFEASSELTDDMLDLAMDVSAETEVLFSIDKLVEGSERYRFGYMPEEAYDELHDNLVKSLRADITARADAEPDGWIETYYNEGDVVKKLRIPRAPMMAYVAKMGIHRLDANSVEKYAKHAHYTPLSSSGMKMPGDDPVHTDAWIGAGFDPSYEDTYLNDSPAKQAFNQLASAMSYSQDDHAMKVLSKGDHPSVKGVVVSHDTASKMTEAQLRNVILLLPEAKPEYLPLATKAKAVIVEVGGVLAHMVLVSREYHVPVCRINHAMLQQVEGREVVLQLEDSAWFFAE